MTVRLTPNGTRGARLPSLPGPLRALVVRLNVLFFRVAGSRIRLSGVPLLLLTVAGAKTGIARSVTLGWFADNPPRPDHWLVVASFAGSAKHPAWYVNLAKNPDRAWVEAGHARQKVRAESLSGSERAEAWARVVALSPGYAAYERTTDREIPIVRLAAT